MNAPHKGYRTGIHKAGRMDEYGPSESSILRGEEMIMETWDVARKRNVH